MAKKLIKLSVLLVLLLLIGTARADSFFMASLPDNRHIVQKQDKIIPLIFIKDMEYYNHTITPIYTETIAEQLSLEPEIIVTEDETTADYYLQPKLLQAKVEKMNMDNSRFSMSVVVELWAKGGVLIDSERQNRYIIINNDEDSQKIAKKMLLKLLSEAVNNIILKIKNKQLNIG